MCSCGSDNKNAKDAFIENIEIYSVTEDETGAGKGELLYKEATQYRGKDQPVWRKFYEPNGTIKAIETYIYEGSGLPVKSKYHNVAGELLSNYVFHNEDNNRTRTISMDGRTDEVLRIETFAYNKKGDRIERVIMDGASNVDKQYRFAFDEYGNETAMTVRDHTGNPLYTYNYTITKKDTDNKWVESWGFRDLKPDQVKYRIVTPAEAE